MTMISYAQNAEDVLLNRLFPVDYRGFYIDIGAAHPTLISVTRHFYDRGWRGINVEPLPVFFDLLLADRPRDINLRLAISDRSGVLTLYHAERAEAESTLSLQEAESLRARGFRVEGSEVEVTTLRDICGVHVPDGTEIDFLKIDVEHHEESVIRGADWNRWRPRVLIIEADKDTSWEPALLESGYLYATQDGINRYYVRVEDRAWLPLLAAPVNCLDHYVPYEHLAPRLETEARLGATCADLHATRSDLEAARADLHATRQEYETLQAEHASTLDLLDRTRQGLVAESDRLAECRVELASSREDVARLVDHLRDSMRDLDDERNRASRAAEVHADLLRRVTLVDGRVPGPALMALSNRLRELACRYPAITDRAKRMLHVC